MSQRSVRLYVEGGGTGNYKQFRNAVRKFLAEICERASDRSVDFNIIAGGSRDKTWQMFLDARKDHPDSQLLVLLDSDGPVSVSARLFLSRLGKPVGGIEEDQCHLMVEIMEAWLVTDLEALGNFYGRGFRRDAIRSRPVESYPKSDLLRDLATATKDTKPGRYQKIQHGAPLLERVSPLKAAAQAPHCARLFQVLREQVG